MKFHRLSVDGAWRIDGDPYQDERGSFRRLFSKREFDERGLICDFAQESVAQNRFAGILRGFHYQSAPYIEAKLVSCANGEAFDVILDIRPGSRTFGKWCSVTLEGGSWSSVYVPPGCAHAVQALRDGTEMLYRISCDYDAAAARGVRWNSPGLNINWPLSEPILSIRDQSLPFFAPSDSIT